MRNLMQFNGGRNHRPGDAGMVLSPFVHGCSQRRRFVNERIGASTA